MLGSTKCRCKEIEGRRYSMDAPPISASQGPMRSLPAKLDSLLLAPEYKLWKRVKNKIRLLKGDLEELVAKYLMEPSEVDYPAATAACWVMEARELSYDIDDFVDELLHAITADARITLPKKRPPSPSTSLGFARS